MRTESCRNTYAIGRFRFMRGSGSLLVIESPSNTSAT